MIDAAITSVDAKRSCVVRSCSCAMACLISPTCYLAPPCAERTGFLSTGATCSRKSFKVGCPIRCSEHRGHLIVIHDAGNVATIAGTFSSHPLHRITKARWLDEPWNMDQV